MMQVTKSETCSTKVCALVELAPKRAKKAC